ncbi:hypothetical protein KRZ98_16465 [Sphingobium sp. AS12]|nr:hypothetical protein [Sphingobium sp. AS12]MBV2149841.1 hypothetical protein [Sphingobium sp. AS12]
MDDRQRAQRRAARSLHAAFLSIAGKLQGEERDKALALWETTRQAGVRE